MMGRDEARKRLLKPVSIVWWRALQELRQRRGSRAKRERVRRIIAHASAKSNSPFSSCSEGAIACICFILSFISLRTASISASSLSRSRRSMSATCARGSRTKLDDKLTHNLEAGGACS